MPGGFASYSIAAFVRIYGIFCNVLYMVFVEGDHFRRQAKNSQAVDPLVSKKSPSKGLVYIT
jgi:hypothetical protein